HCVRVQCAAGKQQRVIIGGIRFFKCEVYGDSYGFVVVLERLNTALMCRDNVDFGACLAQRFRWLGQLVLFKTIRGEDGNSLVSQRRHRVTSLIDSPCFCPSAQCAESAYAYALIWSGLCSERIAASTRRPCHLLRRLPHMPA